MTSSGLSDVLSEGRPRPPAHYTYAVCAAVFAASLLLTLYFLRSMRGGMDMPGGWNMSMMWMLMPGQTWLAAMLLFLAMWESMMVAMMLPSAMPMILLYRRAAAFRSEPRLGLCTLLLAGGYFLVWLAAGAGTWAAGMGLGALAMHWPVLSRAVPAMGGAALIVGGAWQLTAWKTACLRHCRDPIAFLAGHLHGGWRGALMLGLHHGAFCAACCWALMLVQLVLGIMNVAAMVAVAIVIAAEKMWPRGELVARGVGAALVAYGALTLVRAVG